MTHFEVVQTCIQTAALLVSVVTLGLLFMYVRATKGIEKAAVEQSRVTNELVAAANEQTNVSHALVRAANEQIEGLAKPVIVVEATRVNSSEEAILSGGLFSEIGHGARLTNIGTGPALSLEWSAAGRHHSDKSRTSSTGGSVPYLRPAETIQTGYSRGYVSGLNSLTVECKYSSLSGTRYVSHTIIGDENSSQQWDRFRIVTSDIRRT
jgi:hypothetical protein